jgi:hypothetical protein
MASVLRTGSERKEAGTESSRLDQRLSISQDTSGAFASYHNQNALAI